MIVRVAPLLAVVLALSACGGPQPLPESALEAGYGRLLEIANGNHRSAGNIARNQYRHPAQTLYFFGVEPDMTVVEIWPGLGWYTEILAPYLHDRGSLYAAGFSLRSVTVPEYRIRIQHEFEAKMRANPTVYGNVILSAMGPPIDWRIAPPGSADMVLTFRNVHNWIAGGYPRVAFEAFYEALKPGGILGVVEHRAKPGTFVTEMIETGYVTENIVKQYAAAVGFEFVGASEVNANPKDTKDYPEGVWTLPPTLRLGDENREKYLAIGESDRMTLKFRKPAA